LLELLVVLTILALVTASVTLLSFEREKSLRSMAQQVVQQIGLLQQRVVREHKASSLWVDLQRNRIVFPDGHIELPKNAVVTVLSSENQRLQGDKIAIAFYPDGANSGGFIRLETEQERHKIVLYWLSGVVRIDSDSGL